MARNLRLTSRRLSPCQKPQNLKKRQQCRKTFYGPSWIRDRGRSGIGQRRAAVIGALALCGIIGLGSQARASYIVTFSEVGLNVVANGSGSIDTTGLTPAGSFFDPTGFIIPANALEITQPENTGGQEWSGITGPTSFGSGGQTNASSGSGDVVGVAGAGGAVLGLPSGYVSGAPLSSTSTWDNATFASLGLTPGTYVWTWTGGTDDDSYEVVIGAVPEPSPLLLTALGLALTLLARRLGRGRPAC